MPNIKLTSDNLWCEYYTDDTEPEGFYISSVYIGSDSERVNLLDYLTDNFIQYARVKINADLELRGVWS